MDRVGHLRVNRTAFVDRLTDDVHDATKCFGAHRNCDRSAGVPDLLTTAETIRRIHRDRANRVLTEMKSNLDREVLRLVIDCGVRGLQRRHDFGKVAPFELNVDDRSHHLDDLAIAHLVSPSDCVPRACDAAWILSVSFFSRLPDAK